MYHTFRPSGLTRLAFHPPQQVIVALLLLHQLSIIPNQLSIFVLSMQAVQHEALKVTMEHIMKFETKTEVRGGTIGSINADFQLTA